MPNAITAIFGADSRPFAQEIAKMESLAARVGKRMQSSIAGGGHGEARSGVISEMLVLLRKTSRGNFSRVPGSISILAQRMGLLNLIFRDQAEAAKIVAIAYNKLAVDASAAAIAATRKAAASAAAFAADESESEATLQAALADEAKAKSSIAVAEATAAKAVAAETAAAAATAEGSATSASIGLLGTVLGIITGIGAGAYASHKLVKELVDRLSGLKTPDFHPEYIAQHNKSVNQAFEGWKSINQEIGKALTKYNSVSLAAERLSTATKQHFEHVRKMNSLEKETALARTHGPEQRLQIEKKYLERELEISQRQRNAELEIKINEQFGLERTAQIRKQQSDAITVPSKEHDENITRLRNQESEAAKKYLDDLQAAKGSMREKVIRGYNAAALSGVAGSDLDAAERANRAEALRRIRAAEQWQESAYQNDLQRKSKDELQKAAEEAAAKAATLKISIQDQKQVNATAVAEKAAEAAAELQKQRAETGSKQFAPDSVTERERIGAGLSQVTVTALDVSRQHRDLTRELVGLVKSRQRDQSIGGAIF